LISKSDFFGQNSDCVFGTTEAKNIKTKPKVLSGVVVSDKMKDTALVQVERYVKHQKYGKYFQVRKKYKAHDVGNKHKVGEKVRIEECRPISKDKHFKVLD